MLIILLGLPGVGKGAIARKLHNNFNFEIFSTGELLRKEIRDNTALGKMVKPLVTQGKPVSDEMMINLVKERLSTKGNIILEGFPKNVAQAEALDEFMLENGIQLDLVINFSAPEEVIKERVRQRRVCSKCSTVYNLVNCPPKEENICNNCGNPLTKREDDDDVLLNARIERYNMNSTPLLEYYREYGILTEIDTNVPLLDVYYEVLASNVKFTQDTFR